MQDTNGDSEVKAVLYPIVTKNRPVVKKVFATSICVFFLHQKTENGNVTTSNLPGLVKDIIHPGRIILSFGNALCALLYFGQNYLCFFESLQAATGHLQLIVGSHSDRKLFTGFSSATFAA